MVGTNITVLDNFFLYIEKNFFFYNSSTVTKVVEKGAAQLIKKSNKIQTQSKQNSKQMEFMALVSTASPPVSDPFHPTAQPSSQEAAAQLEVQGGQHNVLPYVGYLELELYVQRNESYTALYVLRTKQEKQRKKKKKKKGSPLNSAFYG